MLSHPTLEQHRIVKPPRDSHDEFNTTYLEPPVVQKPHSRTSPRRPSMISHGTRQRALPLYPPEQSGYSTHTPGNQRNITDTCNSSEHMLRRKTPNGTLAAGYDGTPVRWATKPPAPKHILLADSSQQDPSYLLGHGSDVQVPTVLQPQYQPCSGPTASNDSGFYGPFWPDGRFVPYQPAAIRHTGGPNISCGPVRGTAPDVMYQDPYRVQQLSSVNVHSTRNQAPPDTIPGVPGVNRAVGCYGFDQMGSTQQVSLPPLGGGYGLHQHWGLIDNHFSINGIGPSNAQFKEKALMWAHGVYIELLAHLQQVRKGHQSHRHSTSHSSIQLGFYPKSPRQSFPTYATRSIATGRRASHPLGIHADNVVSWSIPMAKENAHRALDLLTNLCQESQWCWIEGMLLGGCVAYALEDYQKALCWYSKILDVEPSHVEGISNLAATLLALSRRAEAEAYWMKSVKLRPSYFEAVEHLVGLLCAEHRAPEAVHIIDFVERSLRRPESGRQSTLGSRAMPYQRQKSCTVEELSTNPSHLSLGLQCNAEEPAAFDFKRRLQDLSFSDSNPPAKTALGLSGYAIPESENGRLLALIHAKGNLLYAMGDVAAAKEAFEAAVLIAVGTGVHGIHELIQEIQRVLSGHADVRSSGRLESVPVPLLLHPKKALLTANLLFPQHGQLPGLQCVPEGNPKIAAISTTSNSLLSLAKIFQDGLCSQVWRKLRSTSSVGDILALYYLSLSLQPSPSTANNVGILLAGVQHAVCTPATPMLEEDSLPVIPGVVPGSGIALALAYYNYGLNLDQKHAHLYTNLGSLLKDIGQLTAAIKMYEKAVACDKDFDIALANLANAVKDQGRIGDAIKYYKRAVAASPDFAEAVCGLANALNSVCDWRGRGGVLHEGGQFDRWHVSDEGMLYDGMHYDPGIPSTRTGWMKRVVDIVGKQLEEGANWGRGILQDEMLKVLLNQLEFAESGNNWSRATSSRICSKLRSWIGQSWEGARVVRLVERAMKRTMHRWYKDLFVYKLDVALSSYARPRLPSALVTPTAPTVLPFHTFTCPLTAKDVRMISQRNALRISCSTLRAPWLPATVYRPPPPPNPALNIGYVSSDFNNHPLAHLMQSVFGFHDVSKAKAFCYATTPSDHSVHREQIEREAPVFHDASSWPSELLIGQILRDQIHILVNLNGYTRGARNEIFAARPTPIQMSFMGFAGTLGAEWCDYLLADQIAVPPETLRPWRHNANLEDQLHGDEYMETGDWVYSENIIFCRDTFFCCDHRQSSHDIQLPWEEEQRRRWSMREELFPNLPDDAVILGNFNQLYKIEPTTFRTWLRILGLVPKAILWLLRFPDLGEHNLKRTARQWASEEVASRIWFTDVAPKNQHISRARVCDLFLDTPECNAHTTAADILWSSTPLLTLPRYKYKMCSRMAASILVGALPKSSEGQLAASELIANSEIQYEQFAIKLATGLTYGPGGIGTGRLLQLRRLLYDNRMTCALFDTRRWVADLEVAYQEAWRRWVDGVSDDIYL